MHGGHPHPPSRRPPPPDDDDEVADEPGLPRCYFCGKRFASEDEVKKTKHDIGHGYHKYVFICPWCVSSKERAENVCGCLGLLAIGAVVAIALAIWARRKG